MSHINPAHLDTLAFSGLDEQEMRRRAIGDDPNIDLFEHELSFIRRRVVASGREATLVVFPDGPATIESYSSFVEKLSHEFNLAIIEIPGFGFSFPLKPEAIQFEESAQILAEAISDLDLPNIVLVGPCVQGLLALRVAELLPDDIAALIIAQTGDFETEAKWLVDSGLDKNGLLRTPFAGQVGFRLNREAGSIDWWLPFSAGENLDVPAMQATARHVQGCGCCFALASQVQAWVENGVADVPNPSQPTAVIWGMADRSHLHSDKHSILNLVPHATMIERDALGHFPDLEDPILIGETARGLLP